MALSDEAMVIYLCSTAYAPWREHSVHPLDPDIGIAWPTDAEPLLSDKDAAAPTLEQSRLTRCCRPTLTARPIWRSCVAPQSASTQR